MCLFARARHSTLLACVLVAECEHPPRRAAHHNCDSPSLLLLARRRSARRSSLLATSLKCRCVCLQPRLTTCCLSLSESWEDATTTCCACKNWQCCTERPACTAGVARLAVCVACSSCPTRGQKHGSIDSTSTRHCRRFEIPTSTQCSTRQAFPIAACDNSACHSAQSATFVCPAVHIYPSLKRPHKLLPRRLLHCFAIALRNWPPLAMAGRCVPVKDGHP